MIDQKVLLFGGGAALVLIAAAYAAAQRGTGSLGAAVGQAVGDGAAGAVVGLGRSVGIPATDEDACTRALAEGRTWDASFACPALRFIQEGIFGTRAARTSTSVGGGVTIDVAAPSGEYYRTNTAGSWWA